MMVLLYPERLGEILQGWVNAYKEGGWFPQFPCPGYRGAMTGSLIDSLFADAVVKNVPGFDVQSAYMGLRKHATEKGDPRKGYGRVGIESYLKLGYLPCDQSGGRKERKTGGSSSIRRPNFFGEGWRTDRGSNPSSRIPGAEPTWKVVPGSIVSTFFTIRTG
jgi:hypothetical protein